MQGMITQRTVRIDGMLLEYSLERKNVKNLNLHVRKDGSVYVSANDTVPEGKIDEFLISKGDFIRNAQDKFKEQEQYRPLPKQYVSGETFYIQGRALRLKVTQTARDKIYSDGVYLFLDVKDQQDLAKKERMVKRFLDKQCKAVFGEIVAELYPVFQKYGVAPPVLRIRSMDTRWGSCLPGKGVITLNKRLLEAPRHCIEYVVMHEYCHFIHPNHSRHFYDFLSMLMPDWKARKKLLDESAVYYL
jgi:predicted metal-dependent hydrolase